MQEVRQRNKLSGQPLKDAALRRATIEKFDFFANRDEHKPEM